MEGSKEIIISGYYKNNEGKVIFFLGRVNINSSGKFSGKILNEWGLSGGGSFREEINNSNEIIGGKIEKEGMLLSFHGIKRILKKSAEKNWKINTSKKGMLSVALD